MASTFGRSIAGGPLDHGSGILAMVTSLRAWFACWLVLTLCAPAYAQQEGEPPPDAPGSSPENMRATDEAREQFMAGIAHFRQHQYRDAIRRFQLAAELVPSADLWFNIARAYEEVSEYDAAVEHYQRYLRDRVDPPDRAMVEGHIVELRARAEQERAQRRSAPTAGELRLTANHDGADVVLDGESAGSSPWPAVREIAPGRHTLTLESEGYIPFRSEVSVERGVPTVAYADLVPETRYRAIRSDPIFAWIAWGIGIAALGASIAVGVEAASRQTTDLDTARTLAAYSDGLLGATIGMGVVGIVLWFVEGRTVSTERITLEPVAPSGVRELDESSAAEPGGE